MDGENNGKPYEQMDDLGGFTPIFGGPPKYFSNGLVGSTTNEFFASQHPIGPAESGGVSIHALRVGLVSLYKVGPYQL